MISWVLIGIFVLFVLFAFVRAPLYRRFGFKICSICAAVSLAWISLLVLKVVGIEISSLLIGILMGESITGLMYLFENTAKKKNKTRLLWLKVIIILLGTLLAYLFLTQGFSTAMVIMLAVSIVFAAILLSSLKNKKHPGFQQNGKFRKEIEKLEERFEHCCD